MAGIDQQVGNIMDAYRGSPEKLQQKYSVNPQLIELLALNKLKEEKDAAVRNMQMQMQNNPATIKQQREQELQQRTQQEIMGRVAPTLNRKMQEKQEQMQQAPQQAQQAQQGIAALAQQMQGAQPQQFKQGGIVQHFQSGMLAKNVQQRVVDLLKRGYSLDEIISKAPQLAKKMQGDGLPVADSAVRELVETAKSFKGTELDPDANNVSSPQPETYDERELQEGMVDSGPDYPPELNEPEVSGSDGEFTELQKDSKGSYTGDPLGFLPKGAKDTISEAYGIAKDVASETVDDLGGIAKKVGATAAMPLTLAYDATQDYEDPEQESLTRRMTNAVGMTDPKPRPPADVEAYDERALQEGFTPAGIANKPAPSIETPPGGIASTMPQAQAQPQTPDISKLEGMVADIDTTSGLTQEAIPQQSAVDLAIEQRNKIQGQVPTMEELAKKRDGARDSYLKLTRYDEAKSARDNMLQMMREDYERANDPERRRAKRISAFLRGFANQTTIGGGFAAASASRANQIEQNEKAVTEARNRMYQVFKDNNASDQEQLKAAVDYGEAEFNRYLQDRQNTTNELKSLTNQQAQIIEQIKSRVSSRELAQAKNKAQQAVEKLRAELKLMGIASEQALAKKAANNPLEVAAKAQDILNSVSEVESEFIADLYKLYERDLLSEDKSVVKAAKGVIAQEIQEFKERGLDKLVVIAKASLEKAKPDGTENDDDPLAAYSGLSDTPSGAGQKYFE